MITFVNNLGMGLAKRVGKEQGMRRAGISGGTSPAKPRTPTHTSASLWIAFEDRVPLLRSAMPSHRAPCPGVASESPKQSS